MLGYPDDDKLKGITIVGMRFYPGSFDYLGKINQLPVEEQCLFLVEEFGNKHDGYAVMLSNGKHKIGSVSAEDAKKVRLILSNWRKEREGSDDVIVVKLGTVQINPGDFEFTGSIKVHGRYRVNERLARKYSDNYRKE